MNMASLFTCQSLAFPDTETEVSSMVYPEEVLKWHAGEDTLSTISGLTMEEECSWDVDEEGDIEGCNAAVPSDDVFRCMLDVQRKRSGSDWSGRMRTTSDCSDATRMSSISAVTASLDNTRELSFDLQPGEFEYSPEQMADIAMLEDDGDVIVTGILAPLASTRHGQRGICPGDTIRQVLHCDHCLAEDTRSQLEDAILLGGRLRLLVTSRPNRFAIESTWWRFKVPDESQDTSSSALGICATIERELGDRIKVQAVHPVGLIADWNAKNPKCQVMPGDWITSVNGKSGNAQEMTAEVAAGCKRDAALRLTIQTGVRPPHGAETSSSRSRSRHCPQRMRVDTAEWTQLRAMHSPDAAKRRSIL